jgi:predicted DNA-binding WGR domain protein
MDVSTQIAAAIAERLTDRSLEDLVDAHLAINYAYFGAIDKTLSGFVVLDSTGDDFTLLDLRDGKQVWWQDHETRDVSLKFDRLEDLVTVRAELARNRASDEDVDADAIERAYRTKSARGSRRIPTPVLLARYQWLVWLLAQPLRNRGTAIQSTDELVRGAIGRFRHTWPRREQHDAAFEAEVGELASDSHLAVYWLLHTTMLCDDARRSRVLAALEDAPELVGAFAERIGSLPLAGELAVVPELRSRRALALTYGGFEIAADEVPAVALRALEIEAGTNSLANGLHVAAGIEKGLLAPADVAAAMGRIVGTAAGPELVLAAIDKKRGVSASSHADVLARMLADDTQPWWLALEALWQIHELAYDGGALVTVTRAILAHDRYHRRALQMAMRAAQIAGEPIAGIFADLELADGLLAPYQRLVERPDELHAITESLDARSRNALAHRVLQRAALNRPDPAVAAWAAGEVIAGDDPNRGKLVGAAFGALDRRTQASMIDRAKQTVDRPDHPLIEVLLALLDGNEPPEHDFAAELAAKRGKEAALVALAPWFHAPVVFDALLTLLERPAGSSVIDPLCNKLLSPFQKDSYVVPRLDAAQAVRVARALIAIELSHPQIHARNAAGHQLYRFSHPGAEAFLIAALTEHAAQFAALTDKGALYDHGKTFADQLEGVVANLYAAVRGLETPGSRTALIERLFAERRSYWRMGSAIKDAFDDALHAEAMTALRARRDARAAGCYAYALVDHVGKAAPLVELAREIVSWQWGADPVERGFFHYALTVGEKAALDARDYELVRTLHAAGARIAEPPLEPDDHARRRGWKNPLEEPDVAKALVAALSGKAEQAKRELAAAGEAARARGKPNSRITDAQLGALAGASVAHRMLHDPKTGEVWFRDGDGRVHYFDGYAVVGAPFVWHSIATDGMRDQLTRARTIDERTLEWDARRAHWRELLRLGNRVIVQWGANNAAPERVLLVFPDAERATAAFAQLAAHPAKGFAATDPYYLDGKGAIVRTYYIPLPDGSYNDAPRQELSIGFDGARDAAIADHVRREVEWLRDANATMLTIEWSERLRRNEDRTVREWLEKRFRDDTRDATWHLRALGDVGAYLEAHGLDSLFPGLDLQLGAPADDAAIDAFAAERAQPVPDSLRTVWRSHGRASWKLGSQGRRLLGPREVLARRDAAREAGADYLAKLPPPTAEKWAPILEHLDVIVETLDGTPVTFLADVPREDGRVFTHAYPDPNDFWWEVSLSWMLATRLLGDLEDALIESSPVLSRLWYGQRRNRGERLALLHKADSFWEMVVDPATGVTSTRFGKLGTAGSTTVERHAPDVALELLAKKTAEKRKAGFRDAKPAKAKPIAKAKPTAKAKPKVTAKAKPKAKAKAKPKVRSKPKPKRSRR